MHFASAESVEKSSSLDKLPISTNSPDLEVPRSNSSDKQSTSLYSSESTSGYPQADDDLSDSDDSDSEFECESSDSEEIDLGDAPQDSSPEEFNSLDVAAFLIELPISREGIQAANFQIPTSEKIATAQSTDAELKQLRQWIEEKRTPSTDELAPQSGHLKCFAQLLS